MMIFKISNFRAAMLLFALSLSAPGAFGQQKPKAATNIPKAEVGTVNGQNDFDFEIGTWKTKLRRLKSPLSNSAAWLNYEGTTIVRKVFNGRSNIVELSVEGPSGKIEGLSLRLFDPVKNTWSLNFANMRDGQLAIPAVGSFKNGRGEFFNEDTYNGQKIVVRFVISGITADSCHFEQSFSADNGTTWEVNWIADDTRISD
jgi:hypothetical protein